MRRSVSLKLFALAIALPVTGAALAEDKACLLEGSFTFAGQTTEIKDCLQTTGVPVARLKQTCESLAQVTASMGGAPGKVTYMPACPAPAQASCEGFFGQPMTSYYYKRDAKLLEDSKQGCIAQGGKWK